MKDAFLRDFSLGGTIMTDMERHDPNTGERVYMFPAWKREYNWRYEVRPSCGLNHSHVVWDKRQDKPITIMRSTDNSLPESYAIEMAECLNQAYLKLYRHKVEILVA